MEIERFEEALAIYKNAHFAIRLPNGILLVCWSRGVALEAQRRAELHMLLSLLADEEQFPGYRAASPAWLLANIVIEGFEDAVEIGMGFGIDFEGFATEATELEERAEIIHRVVSDLTIGALRELAKKRLREASSAFAPRQR